MKAAVTQRRGGTRELLALVYQLQGQTTLTHSPLVRVTIYKQYMYLPHFSVHHKAHSRDCVIICSGQWLRAGLCGSVWAGCSADYRQRAIPKGPRAFEAQHTRLTHNHTQSLKKGAGGERK